MQKLKLHFTIVFIYGWICVIQGCATNHAVEPIDPHLGGLAWMSGLWISDQDGEAVLEEHWTRPRGGTMFGLNRTVEGDETAFFEYLCIQHTQDGIYYMASPKGRQPPTPFKLVHTDTNSATFENPEHDFPQRIIYRREGDRMYARIEGTRNGSVEYQEWTWRLMD